MKAEMSGFISVPKDTYQNTSLYMRIQCEHKKMLFFEKQTPIVYYNLPPKRHGLNFLVPIDPL